MSWKWIMVLLAFFLFIGLAYFDFSQATSAYEISGYALDFEGNSVDGNVTGVVVEIQQVNETTATNGMWKLNFSGISEDAAFSVGIRINTSNQTSFFYIKKFGAETLESQASCRDQTWYLKGHAFYPEIRIDGIAKVILDNAISTINVVNGIFEGSVTACLIPGELYELNLEITSDTLYGHYIAKVVGK